MIPEIRYGIEYIPKTTGRLWWMKVKGTWALYKYFEEETCLPWDVYNTFYVTKRVLLQESESVEPLQQILDKLNEDKRMDELWNMN